MVIETATGSKILQTHNANQKWVWSMSHALLKSKLDVHHITSHSHFIITYNNGNDVSSHISMYSSVSPFRFSIWLKLPSLFAVWLFWPFHTKSHNMKAFVILSHSWSPFLSLTYLYGKKWTFVGLCVAFWCIILRKNSPYICIYMQSHDHDHQWADLVMAWLP